MLSALILAGGKGTRFYPASTLKKPKQFLNLIGNDTMLQITVNRLLKLLDYEHIFICTSKEYVHFINEQLPLLPKKNIIIEPIGRNTAPCILLSTTYINQIYKNTNIIVLPSDSYITDEKEFSSIIHDGNIYLNKNNKCIITLGIMPTRPETGYGYIRFNKEHTAINSHNIYTVDKFIEKPNLEKARQYINEKNYLWNAGMFMFNTEFILEEFSKNYSSYNLLSSLPSIYSIDYFNQLEKKYPQCEAISIDYAIMENSSHIYVIPSNIGWDDVGSWEALERYIEKDQNENIIKGAVISINSFNNLIYSTNKKIFLLDIENIFCIETDEIVIIGNKQSVNKVHKIREEIS